MEGTIYSGSPTVNPAINQVILDTGALDDASPINAGQLVSLKVYCSQSANARYYIQVRDATNTTTRLEFVLMGLASNTCAWDSTPIKFKLNDSERVRVVMQAAMTGTVKAEILINPEQIL